jgi:hypothetical protein
MDPDDPPGPSRVAEDAPPPRKVLGRLLLLLLLSAVGSVYPKLSFPAVFFCIVALVATPKLQGGAKLRARVLLGGSVIGAVIGLFRFVTEEAIPGVVAGGKAAIEKHVVAYCRTVVSAQDHARRNAYFDPDSDGVGSALGFEELSGLAPLPSGTPLLDAPLALASADLTESAAGRVVRESGYLFSLCLPTLQGGFSTDPVARDAERAEREFRIYAWPESLGPGSPTPTYFVDAAERILVIDVEVGGTPAFVGATRPPPCDAVEAKKGWKPWKDKHARPKLPGAPTPSASATSFERASGPTLQ